MENRRRADLLFGGDQIENYLIYLCFSKRFIKNEVEINDLYHHFLLWLNKHIKERTLLLLFVFW